MSKPTTIDEYINAFPESVQERLVRIRALSHDTVPAADGQIKWGYPAFVHPDGVILFMFSGHKKHASLAFTPSTRAAFDDELADFAAGKGTVAVPYDVTLPEDLLRQMIEYRVREHEVDGIKWL